MHWCRLMCIADPFLLRFASKTQCQRITNLYWRRNPAHLQTILYYILDSQFCWQEKNRKTMSNSTPKDIRILRAHEIFVFFCAVLCIKIEFELLFIVDAANYKIYCQNFDIENSHRTQLVIVFFLLSVLTAAAYIFVEIVLRDNKRIFRPKIYIIHSI